MYDIITEKLIVLDVGLPDKATVIDEIANLLAASSRLVDRKIFIKDVYDREEIVPTGIGDLIAIPHARSAAVSSASLVYMRLTSPIRWSDEGDARYIFGIAVPEDNVDNLHLKILSSVAKKLLDDDVKRIIIESTSKQQILETLMDE